MPFKIVRNDITKMNVDVIVNTANSQPVYSDGTDMAVYKAAGEEQLLAWRRKHGVMNEGEVAISRGFKLSAKYIIHAVSPRYIDGQSDEEEKLRLCYRKSLELARRKWCKSIAFPLISTGSFGYPKEEGMRIAVDEINAFLLKNKMLVYLVVFDEEATRLGRNTYPELEAYININYVDRARNKLYCLSRPNADESSRLSRPSLSAQMDATILPRNVQQRESFKKFDEDSIADDAQEEYFNYEEINRLGLRERMMHLSDTFQEYLLYLIKSKGMSNADVYKRAIVTKQVFSKLKLNPDYHPDKSTAMRLCVGARLNLDETKDLLARAGYALSPCDKRDVIFSFFIENNIHDMIEIDIMLEEYGLPCFIE